MLTQTLLAQAKLQDLEREIRYLTEARAAERLQRRPVLSRAQPAPRYPLKLKRAR